MRGTLRILVIFALTMGLFTWGYYRKGSTPWLLGMTSALAHSSSTLLNVFGLSTNVTFRPQSGPRLPSYVLHNRRAAVDIAIDCNGAWAFAIFVAAILAAPGTLKAKAIGLGLGIPVLWVINTIRVVNLFLVAIYIPGIFETLHLYVWQFLIIAAALVLLMLWNEWFTRPADA